MRTPIMEMGVRAHNPDGSHPAPEGEGKVSAHD